MLGNVSRERGKIMKIGVHIALIASMLALTGCAFGTRMAELSYPPNEQGGGLIESAHAAQTEMPRSRNIVLNVSDERSERSRIGNVRNTFGMDTADVVTKDDVAGWVEGALANELTNAGYHVTRSGEAAIGDGVISLQAEILTVYCDVYLTYDGEVSMMVILEGKERDTIRKQFEGEGGVGLNWAATSESYAESLALALKDVISKILTEVAAYH
jgi:hypothetical protein